MTVQLFSVSDPTTPPSVPQDENGLLRLLSDIERAVLEPHLERLTFRNGDMIARTGDSADSICFPLSGIAAVLGSLENDRRYAVALVGNEGFIGWPILRSQGGRGDVLAHLANNLRRLRRAAGLSQGALADASGISRRMITNLEGGDTNISLSSLDRLAEALGVDFVAIVADPDASSRRIEQVAWRGRDVTSEAVLLGSVPAMREAQLWRWSLAPGERYSAEPDPAGWHEMIAVTEGRLRVELVEGSLTIEAGDFAIYSSAQAYAYCNDGDVSVRFIRNVVS